MKKTSLPKLTDAEFEIMDIVWDETETTVNHVWETINRQRPTPLSRTTIQVQMNRLQEYLLSISSLHYKYQGLLYQAMK